MLFTYLLFTSLIVSDKFDDSMMEITFEDKATSRINDTLGELDVVGNINEQTEQERD